MPTPTPSKKRSGVSRGTAAHASRSTSPDAPPQFRFRPRVTAGGAIAIGPGKIALIEAIAETGSITAAAKRLDMSYRRAWLLLDEINRALGKPAVDSAKGGPLGGGSEVTESGLKLVALYRSIETTATQACRADVARLLRLLAH